MRTRGNKGELAAIPLSSHPDRARHVFVNQGALVVESVWFHKDQVIFKFQGVDSISQAEPLVGADVCVPPSERSALPEGEYYQSDLIGCEVVDASGRALGVIEDWQEYGGPALLAIRTPAGGELLIPFAKSICRTIDLAARRIVVDLPEGLEELQ